MFLVVDWLGPASMPGVPQTLPWLILRLSLAFLLGSLVAGLYVLTRRQPRESNSFVATLVLLPTLIAMVTLVIGDSTARAFSLVGALSIIRFRTVVEDTRDTAFVIFAVVVGMASGVGPADFSVLIVGVPIVAVAALLFRSARRTPHGKLELRLDISFLHSPALKETLHKYLHSHQIQATSTARQGAVLEVTYEVRLAQRDQIIPLVSELNQIEGVQSVVMSVD